MKTIVLLLVLAPALGRAADADGRSIEVTADGADVALGSTAQSWWTGRVQLSSVRHGRGGASVSAELHRRGPTSDVTLAAAGHRHRGGWTVAGTLLATPAADFQPRFAGELELHRRVAGGLVAHASYRRLAFPSASVDLFSPAVTWYAGRGEVQGRLYVADDHRRPRSRAWMGRASWDLTRRWRVSGGVARGERIFDVTHLVGDPARGWLAFGEASVAVGTRDRVGLLVRAASEGTAFHQQAIALRWRRGL